MHGAQLSVYAVVVLKQVDLMCLALVLLRLQLFAVMGPLDLDLVARQL